MQSSISTAAERRSLVVELIAEGHGSSQQSLVDALAARGVDVTQATLSRDLKELGAVKGAAGYVVPAASASPLVDALGRWLVSARAAQNLVVLRTPPGGASPAGDRRAASRLLWELLTRAAHAVSKTGQPRWWARPGIRSRVRANQRRAVLSDAMIAERATGDRVPGGREIQTERASCPGGPTQLP